MNPAPGELYNQLAGDRDHVGMRRPPEAQAGAMVSLTGARMKLTDGERTGNLVIWALILLAVLIGTVLLQRKNRKRTDLVMRGLSLALIAVQSAAMVSQALTGGTPEKKPEQYLSVEGEFELGRDTNVIEFVLDTADGTFVRRMLELFPELSDSLAGWVYYPNADRRDLPYGRARLRLRGPGL